MKIRYVVVENIKSYDNWSYNVRDKARGRGLVSIMCSCADRMDADEIAIVLNQKEVAGEMKVLCLQEINKRNMKD